jgi:hypothetical protein
MILIVAIVIFLTASNWIFTGLLNDIPMAISGGFSHLMNWVILGAIAIFLSWTFGD